MRIRQEKRKTKRPSLYLIALVPPEPLRTEVRRLKEEMHHRFHAAHALKSPAHITLQMPFTRPGAEEDAIVDLLAKLAGREEPFQIRLDGFGSFPPRVLFIRIADHTPLISLQQRLQAGLKKAGFTDRELTIQFHPHMTIATRDLDARSFEKAWDELRERSFTASFEAGSLFLLKHSGRQWDMYREFHFKRHTSCA
jgi:2'-5' RNA ligase